MIKYLLNILNKKEKSPCCNRTMEFDENTKIYTCYNCLTKWA
jgi:hypothetical protein